jgi:flagellar biosynthesis GTPase FlhF
MKAIMKKQLGILMLGLFVFLSTGAFAQQADSSRMASVQKQIDKDQRKADKLNRKAEKQDRKQKRHEKKMERKEKKRERKLESVRKNQRKLDEARRDTSGSGN